MDAIFKIYLITCDCLHYISGVETNFKTETIFTKKFKALLKPIPNTKSPKPVLKPICKIVKN